MARRVRPCRQRAPEEAPRPPLRAPSFASVLSGGWGYPHGAPPLALPRFPGSHWFAACPSMTAPADSASPPPGRFARLDRPTSRGQGPLSSIRELRVILVDTFPGPTPLAFRLPGIPALTPPPPAPTRGARIRPAAFPPRRAPTSTGSGACCALLEHLGENLRQAAVPIHRAGWPFVGGGLALAVLLGLLFAPLFWLSSSSPPGWPTSFAIRRG